MDLRSSTDEDLMSAWVGGDPRAFREIFDRYAPRLLGMLRRGLHDEPAAQDLVQQTFLQLHRARADFRAGARFRPWLFTIALNLKREHFRRLSRRREEARDDFEQHVGSAPSGDHLAREQAARLVQLALRELPDNQREVIELHWLAELPFPEVAEAVGASLSAVKVRAHRGYARLREAVTTALGGNRAALEAIFEGGGDGSESPLS